MRAKTIISRLDLELISIGFRRKGVTWNRETHSVVEVVDIQISKSGDRVTMNAGVLSRPVYFTCWGCDAKPFVFEPECVVRARVGQLIDDRDLWWNIDVPAAADQMANCLVARVLPYLARMQSLEAMRDQLASEGAIQRKYPLPAIWFAVLQFHLGEGISACKVLAEAENRTPSWSARVREVAARIGCTSSQSG